MEREAAEKERCRKLALQMRAKVDEQNRRDAEVAAHKAFTFKLVKARSHESAVAAHERTERMKALKAKARREEQEVVKEHRMVWDEKFAHEVTMAQREAEQLFAVTRAHKLAKDEEMRQLQMLQSDEMNLKALQTSAMFLEKGLVRAADTVVRSKFQLASTESQRLGAKAASPYSA